MLRAQCTQIAMYKVAFTPSLGGFSMAKPPDGEIILSRVSGYVEDVLTSYDTAYGAAVKPINRLFLLP